MNDWMHSMRFELSSPKSHLVISGVTEPDLKQLLADLKEKDPDAYAKLTEMIVIDEELTP
jgi:hypothetical protein